LLQFVVLILAAEACCQQFNSSPVHSLAQQQGTTSQDARTGENQKIFQFLTVQIGKNQLSSRDMNPVRSTQTFQHSRQNNAVIQERLQQPVPSKTHEEAISFITPTNVAHVPVPPTASHQSAAESHSLHQTQNFQQVSSHRPTLQLSSQMHKSFQTSSFPSSLQVFQPSASFPAQHQIPVSIQKTQIPAAHSQQRPLLSAHQQTAKTANPETVQIKSTSVQQTLQWAQQFQNSAPNSHVQQPTTSPHQQQLTKGTTVTQSSSLQTFPSQQFSTQTEALPQARNIGKTVSSHIQHSQQERVDKIKASQSQQQQRPQKQIMQNEQRVDEVTLSPEEELFQKQAKNAKYFFDSALNDNIMDNTQIRQEKRDGLELSGLYSYSDGFYKRTVHYEADEHGYRVTK
jgi:hypothetical protein